MNKLFTGSKNVPLHMYFFKNNFIWIQHQSLKTSTVKTQCIHLHMIATRCKHSIYPKFPQRSQVSDGVIWDMPYYISSYYQLSQTWEAFPCLRYYFRNEIFVQIQVYQIRKYVTFGRTKPRWILGNLIACQLQIFQSWMACIHNELFYRIFSLSPNVPSLEGTEKRSCSHM